MHSCSGSNINLLCILFYNNVSNNNGWKQYQAHRRNHDMCILIFTFVNLVSCPFFVHFFAVYNFLGLFTSLSYWSLFNNREGYLPPTNQMFIHYCFLQLSARGGSYQVEEQINSNRPTYALSRKVQQYPSIE